MFYHFFPTFLPAIFTIESTFLQNNSFTDGKDDFSDLAPNQRRKKLRQKVDELQVKVDQETAARNGLMKMKVVYEDNHALGDPMTVEGKIKVVFLVGT